MEACERIDNRPCIRTIRQVIQTRRRVHNTPTNGHLENLSGWTGIQRQKVLTAASADEDPSSGMCANLIVGEPSIAELDELEATELASDECLCVRPPRSEDKCTSTS